MDQPAILLEGGTNSLHTIECFDSSMEVDIFKDTTRVDVREAFSCLN